MSQMNLVFNNIGTNTRHLKLIPPPQQWSLVFFVTVVSNVFLFAYSLAAYFHKLYPS
jgi:hypothetical protein